MSESNNPAASKRDTATPQAPEGNLLKPVDQIKSQALVSGFYSQSCPRRSSGQTRPELKHANSKNETSGAPADLLELDPEWLKIADEDSAVTIQRVGLGSSFVGLGAGLDVRSLKCGFDTCLIEMKNLSLDVTHAELCTLLSTQGVRSRSFRILGTQQYGDKTLRVLILAEKEAAKNLAKKLDGAQFKDRVIEFNVAGYNSLSAIQSVMPNILTLSWESPESTSMIAVLSYQDPAMAHAFVEQVNREGLGGHPLRAHVVPEPGSPNTVVKTTKLSDGMERHIFQFYSLSRAQAILFQPDDHRQELIACVKQRLGLGNMVQTFDRTASCAGKGFCVLSVTFDSWRSVRQASELLSGKRLKPDQPIIRCYLPFKKPIHHAVYIPLEPCCMHYWNSIPEQHRCELSMSSMHSNYGCIPLGDENAINVRVDSLDKNPSDSYWRWACSAAPMLNQIQAHLGLSLIELSWSTRTLKLFADDQGTLDRAVRQIKMDIERTSFVQRVITSDRRLIRSLQASGALAMLKQKFEVAGQVSLDTSSSRCILKHHESCSSEVHALLAKHKAQIEKYQQSLRPDDDIEASCPICLDDFSDGDTQVQKLVCGHVYCTGCLHQFFVTAPERNKIPLLCIGNEDRCRAPIPIPIIQSLLSPLEFDSLIDKALNAYVGQHAEQYKYCPTPTCSQLYRVTKDQIVSTCPSCTLSLCTACHKPGHSGMTCAERRAQDPSEHDALNNQWASSHGAKKCPVCQVWIQKTDGCNHVKCRCGAHICWLCEQSFATGNETYRHLRGTHGMWGMYLDQNGGVNVGGVAMQGGGAGQQRVGAGYFGAPPRPGEVLIGPGGEVAVGAGVNAAWFARRVAQGGGGGIAHLANMVPNLRLPIAPQNPPFFPAGVARPPNQAPGNAVYPPQQPVMAQGRPVPNLAGQVNQFLRL